ncbi:hypothetical protein M9458_004162, partial [Cirrhinus mrigala]
MCFSGESDTLVCLEDGLWSYPEAYCKIECPDPPSFLSVTEAGMMWALCAATNATRDITSLARSTKSQE